ncbi:MAG: 2-isopropylmalate synthase, partial [Clostridia bacterium]|nr:2-isopropylmalate synthase [Clostridia bacterium]
NEVARAASLLGYQLSDEDMARVFEAFTAFVQKKPVGSRELDAIIANVALQVPPTYRLSSYVENSGNIISATAHVVLDKNGESVQGLSTGDGPIDAAFMALERIVGHHYELDDFQIQSVTGGREAMGEALVKLRDGGKLYSGRGISTDIIGASIRAYLNALNKIVYRETNI